MSIFFTPKIESIYNLNIFSDFDNIDDFNDDSEFKFPKSLISSYKKVYIELSRKVKKLEDTNYKFTSEEIDELEDVMYSGSDAYETEEMMEDELPKIYDRQIDVVKQILGDNGIK